MKDKKTWRLMIQPQTHIRTTKNERWLFAEGVTDEYLIKFGTKKYNERVEKGAKNPGTPNSYLNRKYAIKRYFDYKRALREEAQRIGLVLPGKEAWIKFYVPMPKSWSKKKKNQMCFQLCEAKPDTDNFVKALKDSLLKNDAMMADYRSTKYYYDGVGHIEISLGELPPANGYAKYIIDDKIK